MSKHINVNPDHYKVAGRERPGHDLAKPPSTERIVDDGSRERWEKQMKKRKEKR